MFKDEPGRMLTGKQTGGEAMQTNNAPSGEKILKTLIELYADQMGVKVKYSIKDKEADPER